MSRGGVQVSSAAQQPANKSLQSLFAAGGQGVSSHRQPRQRLRQPPATNAYHHFYVAGCFIGLCFTCWLLEGVRPPAMKEHMGVVIAGGSGAKLTCRGCLDLANLINSGPPLPTSLVELPDLINLLAAGPPPGRRQTWPKRDTFENSEKKPH